MYFWIFSLVFVLFAALAALIGVFKGKKYIWQYSVARIILTVASVAMTTLISWLVCSLAIRHVVSLILDNINVALFDEIPSLSVSLVAIAAMIIAPIMFLILYPFVRLLFKWLTKPLIKLFVLLENKIAERIAEAKSKKSSAELSELPGEAVAKEAVAEEEIADEAMVEEAVAKEAAVEVEEAPKPAAPKGIKKKYAEFVATNKRWIGGLCGGVCGILTLFVLAIPAVGALDVVDGMASVALHTIEAQDETGIVELVADVLDGCSKNIGTYAIKYSGGGLVYNALTTYDVNGQSANLKKETNLIRTAGIAVAENVVADIDGKKKAEDIRSISVAFDNSTILPILSAELVSAASDDWSAGREFYGMSVPSLSKNLDPTVQIIISSMAHSTPDTIKEDFKTIVNIAAVMVEYDVMSTIEENPLGILSKEEATSLMLYEMLENPRLYVSVDGISDFAMTLFMNTIEMPSKRENLYEPFLTKMALADRETREELVVAYARIFDACGLRLDAEIAEFAADAKLGGEDMREWTKQNIAADASEFADITEEISLDMIIEGRSEIKDNEAEAEALAHAYAEIFLLMNEMNEDGFDAKVMLRKMGPVLDSFKKTETIGPKKTEYIVCALLQSQLVHDMVGLSVIEATNTASTISRNSATQGYSGMMHSLSLVVDTVDKAQNQKDETKAAVEEMLNDLTTESAEVIEELSTENLVKKYGVPDRSAGAVSDMIADTFGDLADAKKNGMSEEEFEKESAAVTHMLHVMMSAAEEGDHAKTFGANSDTNLTAEQFVNEVMDSKVMINTVVDTVYKDGENPTKDPLVSERALTGEEKTDLLAALNARWDSSDKSENTKKQIVALASVVNVAVEISGNAVVVKA